MKKSFLAVLAISTISFSVFSCSNDDSVEQVISEAKDLTITSYSNNYGYSGDIIKVNGENFPSKDKCKVYFDDVLAEVISVSEDGKEMNIKLPEISSGIPTLRFEFGNSKFTNSVTNEYQSNIGVINKKVGEWVSTKSSIPLSDVNIIQSSQIKNNGNIYIASHVGYNIHRSFDNGLTWKQWTKSGIGFYGDFHAIENNEGWYSSSHELVKVASGSTVSETKLFDFENHEFTTVYVDQNMIDGVIVNKKGFVFKTIDGTNFSQVFAPSSTGNVLFRPPFKLDSNNIWSIGYNDAGSVGVGAVLYCNGNNEVWHEYVFPASYGTSTVENIFFTNSQTGFCTLRRPIADKIVLFKTTNGGATWSEINEFIEPAKTTSITFVDNTHGYLVLDNNIHVTKDGGNTWNVDFTTQNPIQDIKFSNNCVYAITKGEIVRKFL